MSGLLWHTLRHLRPVQITGRIRFRLARPRPNLSPAPPLRARNGAWSDPCTLRSSMTGPAAFRFLNRDGSLDQIGWDDPAQPRLWRYNLHYFDDLSASGAASRRDWHRALIARWIEENPPGQGTGWEPYPLGRRAVNWIKWAFAGNRLDMAACASLAVQARWLMERVEHHLQGNHLIANAKALLFLGAFFEGNEADSWREAGRAILLEQLPQQILFDGGHCERSPLYHALALEDLLDLCNLLQAYGLDPETIQACRARIPLMLGWLFALSHPDNEIAFFNDAAFAIAPSPNALQAYAARLGLAAPEGIHDLSESGYLRLVAGPATVLLDCAPLGSPHLTGHGHADTLSFELSVGTQRVLVNGGTGEYGTSAERQRQRGTKAHNTLGIDGVDSSEVWAGFRTARRARVADLRIAQAEGCTRVSATHDGYQRLSGKPMHSRLWELNAGSLLVADRVSGPAQKDAVARFRFHPALQIEASASDGRASRDGQTVLRWRVEKGRGVIEPSTWHPEFGLSLPTRTLAIRCEENQAAVRFSFEEGACTSFS